MASACVLLPFCNPNLQKYYSPVGRVLGHGGYGVTYMLTDVKTNEAVACKTISKDKVSPTCEEATIMRHLPKHPNIVALQATYEDENNLHLVMELCEGGTLLDSIAWTQYSKEEVAVMICSVIDVVKTCHEHGVMHRDLKLENVLFATKDKNSPLKVIDFGLSLLFKPGERYSKIVGTLHYIAPEMWEQSYGQEIDMWSAGVILYILLVGRPPFDGSTDYEVMHQIVHGDLDLESHPWPNVSDSAKSLVWHMLDRNVKTRFTAHQALKHPWLQPKTSKTLSHN